MASEDTLVITYMNGNEQVFYIPRSRTLGNRGVVDEVIYNWNQAEKKGLWVYLGGYQEEGETDPLEDAVEEPGEDIWQQKYIYAGYERYCVFDETEWKNSNGVGDAENESVELRGIWQVRYNGHLKMQRFKGQSVDRLICITPLNIFWERYVQKQYPDSISEEFPYDRIAASLKSLKTLKLFENNDIDIQNQNKQEYRAEFSKQTNLPEEILKLIETTHEVPEPQQNKENLTTGNDKTDKIIDVADQLKQ